MSQPPGGDQGKSLPTMSWESIVKKTEQSDDAVVSSAAAPPVTEQPAAAPALKFEIPPLDLSGPPRNDTPPPADPPTTATPAPRTDPPAPAVAPNVELPSLGIEMPSLEPDAPEDDAPAEMPSIREATPVPALTPEEQAALDASNSAEVPTLAPPSAPATTETPVIAPANPSTTETPVTPPPAPPMPPPPAQAAAPAPAAPAPAAQPALAGPQPAPANVAPAVPPPVLPSHQPSQAGRTPSVPNPLAVSATQKRRPPRQRRSGGGGFAMLLTLLVLAGLVTAGIVYGRPYLFPDEWDAAAKPYKEAIEEVRGTQFTEPLTVTSEPALAYQSRMTAQLLGDWERELPMWRALGLANGAVTELALADLVADWQGALYSREDGQLYHDATLTGSQLDAALTRAMSEAALDQDHGWSIRQSNRTLDDAALVEAHILQQTRQLQALTEFDAPIPEPDVAGLAFLPPILGYELLAPRVYAELLPPVAVTDVEAGDSAANPLKGLGDGSPGPLPAEALETAPDPELIEGEEIVEPATAMDRSFWYLVLAGYVDATTAYAASEAIVDSSLTVTDRSGTTCAYATFAGTDAEATALLQGTLESWVGAAPAEFSAAFSVLNDGTLQLLSCDPGARFENGSRFGVARELIGWRVGHVAVIVGVTEDGGTDADVVDALATFDSSDPAVELATASFAWGTAAEAADLARDAVARRLGSAVAPSESGPAFDTDLLDSSADADG